MDKSIELIIYGLMPPGKLKGVQVGSWFLWGGDHGGKEGRGKRMRGGKAPRRLGQNTRDGRQKCDYRGDEGGGIEDGGSLGEVADKVGWEETWEEGREGEAYGEGKEGRDWIGG